MEEGDYHEAAHAHWMNINRLWLPWGKPTDQARWESMRRLFEVCPVERLHPLQVMRMIGAPYANQYQVLDGHHRVATARERGITLLLVYVWRQRRDRYVRVLTPQHQAFDRV